MQQTKGTEDTDLLSIFNTTTGVEKHSRIIRSDAEWERQPRCGAYLGHVFDDGSAPSGKRYCVN